MFVRLTARKRAKAGWLVALLYLFCVLAPGAAPALGHPAPWLPDGIKQVSATDTHHGHEHDVTAGHHADTGGAADHRHDGTASPGPCCAMLCLTAIAADLPAVVRPTQPILVCVSDSYRRPPGEPPPLLYRPPIA